MTPISRHSVDIPVNPLTHTARKRHQETLQASPALSEGTSIASSDGPATPKSTFMASPQIGSGLGKETSWSTLDSESSNFSGFSSKTVQSNTTASTQSSPQQRFHVTNNRLSIFAPAQQFQDDDSTASIHAQDSRLGGGEGIDWFKIKSGRRHVPLPMREAPYLLGYEKSVDTWASTANCIFQQAFGSSTYTHSPKRTSEDVSSYGRKVTRPSTGSSTSSVRPPTPKRVLDLGCGYAGNWIIQAAQEWPSATFIGLDLAPNLIPLEHLPESIRNRISFVQANFLSDRLPFQDGEFDFVRLSLLGCAVPESGWNDLIEEASRVCSDEGSVEVLDWNSQSTSGMSGKVDEEALRQDVYSMNLKSAYVDLAAHSSLDARLLSPYPLSTIPTALVLGLKDVHSTGVMHFSSASDLSRSPKSTNRYAAALDDTAIRVLAHTHIDRFVSISDIYHQDFIGEHPDANISLKDSEAMYQAWRKEKLHSVNMAGLLEDCFGWTCGFDTKSETLVSQNVHALNREHESAQIRADIEQDAATSATVTELRKKIREAEVDLAAVRKRLGKGEAVSSIVSEGSGMEIAAFVGKPRR